MSHPCVITGKTTARGNTVSHSNRRVRRLFKTNIQKKRMLNPATGRMVTVHITPRGLRTLEKWAQAGKKVDLSS